jgi:hypothetical protein
MKLRIRGNSIRLRLQKDEVAALRERGSVEEAVEFSPSARLVYAIERGAFESVGARFDGARVVVQVPDAVALDFCDTDRVGFEATAGALRVLVEKDWQCLAPRDEDESNAYPHPRAGGS